MRTAPQDLMPNAPEGMLTLLEASRIARVSPITINRWIKRGDLSAVKQSSGGPQGYRYLVTLEDLTAYLDRKKADLNLNAPRCACGHLNSQHASMFGRCSGTDTDGDNCPCSGVAVRG